MFQTAVYGQLLDLNASIQTLSALPVNGTWRVSDPRDATVTCGMPGVETEVTGQYTEDAEYQVEISIAEDGVLVIDDEAGSTSYARFGPGIYQNVILTEDVENGVTSTLAMTIYVFGPDHMVVRQVDTYVYLAGNNLGYAAGATCMVAWEDRSLALATPAQ